MPHSPDMLVLFSLLAIVGVLPLLCLKGAMFVVSVHGYIMDVRMEKVRQARRANLHRWRV